MEKQKHVFSLIFPPDIWTRIKTLAERNRRPITQEILLAILAHLEREGA